MRLIRALAAIALISVSTAAAERPNFIIIFADDQGWADLGSYGSPDIRTPNIDRLAAEGIRFTSFYAAPFCGPSRAALMTGSYPPRNSLAFNHGPKATTGIHPDEITLAELLSEAGYKTMMIGKWHLGDLPQFLPHRNGFDHWLGIPFSNDMWRYHPKMPYEPDEDERMQASRERTAYTGLRRRRARTTTLPPERGFPHPLPLMEDDEVIELDPDQTKLTTLYTERAVDFIEQNRDESFFLYLPHAMPHVPLFVSKERAGRSLRGLYGDVIEEIDWGVGRILAKLDELGIDDKTLIVYTSDNGPWLQYGVDAGSAGPFRDGKSTTYEGGMRVPGLVRWPKKIPAGQVSSEPVAAMDLYPTFAKLADLDLPTDRTLDGRDIWPLLSGQAGARSPHEYFYYFHGSGRRKLSNIQAVRHGKWKLHVKRIGHTRGLEPVALYDLHEDPGESFDRLKLKPRPRRRHARAYRELCA